jgi:hypothetical protein
MKSESVFLLAFLLAMGLIVADGKTQEISTDKDPLLDSSVTGTLTTKPGIDFTAERRIIQIDWLGRSNEIKGQIYSSGKKVRVERNDIDPPEISIFDYERRKEYRLYDDDRIFFESELSNTGFYKARREELIQADEGPNVEVAHLLLGEMVWDGRPCEIILKIRTLNRQGLTVYDYTFLWEALDLDHRTVKAAYYRTARMFIIVEYRNARQGSLEPTLFEPPEDYLNLTPY